MGHICAHLTRKKKKTLPSLTFHSFLRGFNYNNNKLPITLRRTYVATLHLQLIGLSLHVTWIEMHFSCSSESFRELKAPLFCLSDAVNIVCSGEANGRNTISAECVGNSTAPKPLVLAALTVFQQESRQQGQTSDKPFVWLQLNSAVVVTSGMWWWRSTLRLWTRWTSLGGFRLPLDEFGIKYFVLNGLPYNLIPCKFLSDKVWQMQRSPERSTMIWTVTQLHLPW